MLSHNFLTKRPVVFYQMTMSQCTTSKVHNEWDLKSAVNISILSKSKKSFWQWFYIKCKYYSMKTGHKSNGFQLKSTWHQIQTCFTVLHKSCTTFPMYNNAFWKKIQCSMSLLRGSRWACSPSISWVGPFAHFRTFPSVKYFQTWIFWYP